MTLLLSAGSLVVTETDDLEGGGMMPLTLREGYTVGTYFPFKEENGKEHTAWPVYFGEDSRLGWSGWNLVRLSSMYLVACLLGRL